MQRWQVRAGWVGVLGAGAGQWQIVGIARNGDRWSSAAGVSALAVWLAGLLVVVFALRPAVDAPSAAAESGGVKVRRTRAALGVSSIAVGALLVGGADADPAVAVPIWCAAIAALLVAAAGHEVRIRRPVWRPPTRHGAALVATIGVAAVVRLVALGRHPRIADGDGAGFALTARNVAEGRLRDPFATGYLDHPTLFAFVQRGAMAIAGDTLAGARAASAVAGTLAVVATYLLGRRLAGARFGLVAAAVLAVLPVHVHFSRLALNNVFDSLTLATALWLTLRAIDERRRVDAAAAGLVLGLGQYFYFTARLVAVLVVVVAVWRGAEAIRGGGPWARIAELWLWLCAGAAVAFAPLGLQFLRYPETFNSRGTQVLLMGNGEAARNARAGTNVVAMLGESIGRSLLAPFGNAGLSTFHPPAPTIGWQFALPLTIGVAMCTVSGRRSSTGVVALVWWAVFVAVGFTTQYPITRWVVATPVVAIAIAHGLTAAWQLLGAVFAGAGRILVGVVIVAVMAASALIGEFTGPPLARYGDVNSLVATRLAEDLAREPAGTPVFAAMPPRMGLDSHHLTALIAPGVAGVDVVEPIATVADVPQVDGRTVFVFLPERVDELAVVQTRYPGGETIVRVAEGIDLYTLYRSSGVRPPMKPPDEAPRR